MNLQSIEAKSAALPLPLPQPEPLAEERPECPACECGMRFIGAKGLCLIWVCQTCGHALIRRTEAWEEEYGEQESLIFLDELLG